jgi:hypothetical protein
MAAAGYRISAAPKVEGGRLKGVTFTAESRWERREWFTRECGQFETVFARLMPENMARLIMEALEAGDAVEFPGTYEEEQFERGFSFEWSPVHLVVPPRFAGA